MTKLIFDYLRFGKRFLPVVPLILNYKQRKVKTFAYVDSGASLSCFQSGTARLLGLPLERGKEVFPKGTAGHIRAYKHKIAMQIGEKEILVESLFSDELASEFDLLGLKDVFDRFKITFDNKNKKIVFEQC